MKIVGSTTCPVGSALGHDADECRANLLDDGGTLCVICGTCYPKMSQNMQRVWRIIASAGFSVPNVTLGSATKAGSSAYDAACLSGYDPVLSDQVYAVFCAEGGEKVVLKYEQHNENALLAPDLSLNKTLSPAELALIPCRVKTCMDALAAMGFCLRHFGDELNMRIAMTCGRPLGTMGFMLGVDVELSWPKKD